MISVWIQKKAWLNCKQFCFSRVLVHRLAVLNATTSLFYMQDGTLDRFCRTAEPIRERSHAFCKRINGFLSPKPAISKATTNQTKSDNFPVGSENESGRKRKSPFLHPYLQLSISIILTATSQIFLKIGIDTQFVAPWYAISNFFAYWVWLGILAVIGSLFSWLYALRSLPLIIAFNLTATNHIMVAFGSWLFLGEAISTRRWIGIFLVALGVFFVARPAARAEEKL